MKGLVSGVNDNDTKLAAKGGKLSFQLDLLLLQGWKNLQLIPDLDATLPKLALGLAELGLILLESNAGINQKVAIGNLILDIGKLLLGLGSKGSDLILQLANGILQVNHAAVSSVAVCAVDRGNGRNRGGGIRADAADRCCRNVGNHMW